MGEVEQLWIFLGQVFLCGEVQCIMDNGHKRSFCVNRQTDKHKWLKILPSHNFDCMRFWRENCQIYGVPDRCGIGDPFYICEILDPPLETQYIDSGQ